MRVPTKKKEEKKFPVECANCRKTAWVTEDDLHYCVPCYRKITRRSNTPW